MGDVLFYIVIYCFIWFILVSWCVSRLLALTGFTVKYNFSFDLQFWIMQHSFKLKLFPDLTEVLSVESNIHLWSKSWFYLKFVEDILQKHNLISIRIWLLKIRKQLERLETLIGIFIKLWKRTQLKTDLWHACVSVQVINFL